MAVKIKGVELRQTSVKIKDDGIKITGKYHIMMLNGNILAKQAFNSYEGVSIKFSKATFEAFSKFSEAVDAEIMEALGLNHEPEVLKK